MRIAFLTSERFARLYEDDLPLVLELEARGHTVTPVVWTTTDAQVLGGFDLVLMRTPWDWFHHRARFRAFLEALTHVPSRVVNPPALMQAFADKRYLARLQAKGVAVVPTEELAASQLHRVPELLAARGWSRAVLKPAFTANAVGAHRFEAADAPRVLAEVGTPGDDGAWLLQPFVPSIAQGELSFIFFGGRFSHAVRKRPVPQEWRVQHEYGGQSEPYAAPAREVEEATALLTAAAPGTVYARVDVVPWEGRLHLMELELVEPELFLRLEPHAAARFADALLP